MRRRDARARPVLPEAGARTVRCPRRVPDRGRDRGWVRTHGYPVRLRAGRHPARPTVTVERPYRRRDAACRGTGDAVHLRRLPRRFARTGIPAFAQLYRQSAGMRRGPGVAGYLRQRQRPGAEPRHGGTHAGPRAAAGCARACRGRAPGRDDRRLRAHEEWRQARAIRPGGTRGPARLSRCTGAWRTAAPAGRHPVLDAALLHRRRRPAPAGRRDATRHRRSDRGGDLMRLTRVHVDTPLSSGLELALPENAAAHLSRVLRLAVGDECVLFNGDGTDYAARITSMGKRELRVTVASGREVDNESPLAITLLQGIARGEKMDLILQKATELGVNAIAPLWSQRSEVKLDEARAEKRLAHWRGVVTSACEQCGRARVPGVAAPVSLSVALGALPAGGLRLILDPEGELALRTLSVGDEAGIVLAVGPEGGWSPADREQLRAAGFQGLKLGPRILRTETAGLAAIAALQSRLGDLA